MRNILVLIMMAMAGCATISPTTQHGTPLVTTENMLFGEQKGLNCPYLVQAGSYQVMGVRKKDGATCFGPAMGMFVGKDGVPTMRCRAPVPAIGNVCKLE